MHTESETHQEPKAHNTYTRLMVMILVLLVTSACAVAMIGYLGSQVEIGGPGDFGPVLTFTSYLWGKNDANITLTIQNTVPRTLTIINVQVDGSTANYKVNGTYSTLLMQKGSFAKIVITPTGGFISGIQYTFMIVTATGNQFGPYTLCAP